MNSINGFIEGSNIAIPALIIVDKSSLFECATGKAKNETGNFNFETGEIRYA